jgi:N utilization substance protein B
VGARSKARKRALDVLYEAEQRSMDPLVVLQDRLAQNDPPVPEYAVSLVQGVVANRARIDELLSTYAQEWTVDRFPAVDLQVLRIGTYELLWCAGVPDEVAVSEAVELAASLSTAESPAFVNGLLGRLLQLKPALGVPTEG